jgi:tRNA(Ile)-lysidine synthase
MNISLKPGKYIVAVSGGVDSMVLLNLLNRRSDLELVVAHFDHGIRTDSDCDRQLVQEVAGRLGLTFVYEAAKLGPRASEAAARAARYAFLERMRQVHGAKAIVMAHHQDDVLETAILNILRGTGRKGLTSLSSRSQVVRPMLHLPKKVIREYADSQGLKWREDSTNTDEKYLRNYVRHRILPRFDDEARTQLISIIEQMHRINYELDTHLINLMHNQPGVRQLDRGWFISLPHAVAREFLASWLRARGIGNFDTKTLERVVVAAKVRQVGSLIDIMGGASLVVKRNRLALVG